MRSLHSRVPHRASALVFTLLALCGCAPRAHEAKPIGVAVRPEYYAHSVAALGFPGFRRAFQCGHGVQLGAGDAAFAFTLDTGEAVSTSPVWFERDGVPLAHGWMIAGADSAAWEAAAYRVPGATDTLLVASVRVTILVRGESGRPSTTGIRLEVRDSLEGPHSRPWDAAEPAESWTWEHGRATRDGRVVGALAVPGDWRVSGGEASARLRASAASTDGVYQFWLADRPVGPEEAKRIEAKLTHESHAARTRAAWREWFAKGAVIETPDTLVNEAYRAAIVTLLQGHERSGDGWVPIGNPFQYRDVWLRDGARVVRALALAGWTDLARADALTLTRFQLPSGGLVSQYGQLDGTGQAMWACEQAAGIPPDTAWSRRYAPTIAAASVWLRNQRVLLRMTSHAIRIEWPQLLPYGDPRDGELVRAPLVGNDAWAIAGQASALALATRIHDQATADLARSELASHRAAFLSALERVRHPDVPPVWGAGGHDWGNCYVGFPTGVLPAPDPRLAALADRIWTRSGLHLASYGTPDSLHTYLGTDLAIWALLADRPADARATLADLLRHSSSTLGQAELFCRSTREFGRNLPPHGTAAAQLVELVRDCLVLDVTDTLQVAAVADSSWWRGARTVGAPTRFGRLDLALSRPAADRFEASWSEPGAPVAVRVPEGFVLVRAEGGTPRGADRRWVDCGARAGRVTLVVRPS